MEQPLAGRRALLASAEGYTPRANQLLDAAREKLGTIDGDRRRSRGEPAAAEAPAEPQAAPQAQAEGPRHAQPQDGQAAVEAGTETAPQDGAEPAAPPKKRQAPPPQACATAADAERHEPPTKAGSRVSKTVTTAAPPRPYNRLDARSARDRVPGGRDHGDLAVRPARPSDRARRRRERRPEASVRHRRRAS